MLFAFKLRYYIFKLFFEFLPRKIGWFDVRNNFFLYCCVIILFCLFFLSRAYVYNNMQSYLICLLLYKAYRQIRFRIRHVGKVFYFLCVCRYTKGQAENYFQNFLQVCISESAFSRIFPFFENSRQASRILELYTEKNDSE